MIPYEETWGYLGESLKHSVEFVLFDQPGQPTINRYFFERKSVAVLMKDLQWDSLVSEGNPKDQDDLRFSIELLQMILDCELQIVGETKAPAKWTEELVSPGVSTCKFDISGIHKLNIQIEKVLTGNEKQEYVQTFKVIDKLNSKDRDITSLAITRYTNALSRSGRFRQEDCILDIAIALEIVYGLDGGEITHKLSTRAGWYLGNDYKERDQIREKIKLFYKLRSCIVHGEKKSRDCKKTNA
ncbi:MAG: HEPN domain-containing protein [Gemmatimonadetes bacterium]|nr:HEPN domain-containing protein [Gemmatimonadota bacterium]